MGLRPALTHLYWGLSLLDVSGGQYVLLSETEGGAAAVAFSGLRLADLEVQRDRPLPPGLVSALRRDSGCGHPMPFPQATFVPTVPGGVPGLLVRDGNSLNWWLGKR
ncbi:hypothetical protein [Deinococcus navajonensis]|uniref:Uncharacterized protein n=1 Tax=Deinococcus navajonensis TaxID=309884 RepID=A0ABV8XRX0_9DEIO